jgi:hypothetical protein
VHDSVAGFIGNGMREFHLNGHGIAKFRRIYFGHAGDLLIRAKTIRENEDNRNASRMPKSSAA